jgi:hypothetical protein
MWLCAAAFAANALRRRKSKLFLLPALCIFLILFLAKSLDDYIYMGAFSIIAFYLGVWGIKGINYDTEYEILRRGIILCAATFFISVVSSNINLFNKNSAQYIIIFLVSSVLLLRTLRYSQYNSDSSEARKINNRYSIMIILLSAVLSISYVREIVVKAVKYTYNFIVEGFMWLFSWLFLGIGYILAIAQNALARLIARINRQWPQLFQNVNPPKDVETPEVEEIRKALFDNVVINVILKVVIIFIILYIIIRILRYFAAKSKDEGQYFEEREFITKSSAEGQNPLKKLFSFLKPKNNNEHIRLYYQ